MKTKPSESAMKEAAKLYTEHFFRWDIVPEAHAEKRMLLALALDAARRDERERAAKYPRLPELFIEAARLLEVLSVDAPEDLKSYQEIMDVAAAIRAGEGVES